jgi:tripartite-type tricarboxylate transporter receptor subunit TctC
MKRKSVLVSVLGILGVLLATGAGAQSQVPASYPTRPVRIVAPFPPGGVADVLARAIQPGLQEALGQQVVIDNKPGAGGNIGAEIVAKAEPDGYTLLLASAGILTINEFLYSKMPFDTATAFSPITVVGDMPNIVVVSPKTGIGTLKELIGRAKDMPGKLNFGSAGNGTSHHLVGELYKMRTGTSLVHVPYKGAGPMMQDLLGGQVDMAFDGMGTSAPQIKSGKLRALAVSTPQRSPLIPDVPTLKELGVADFEVTTWYALWAVKGTPKDIQERMYREVVKALQLEDVKKVWEQQGAVAGGQPPAEFGRFVHSEVQRWGKVVKDAGIKIDN